MSTPPNPEKPSSSPLENLKGEITKRADVALDILKKPKETGDWMMEKMKDGKDALEKEFKESTWIPLAIKGSLFALGALGAYKAYNWAFSEKEEPSDKEKVSNGMSGVALGAVLGLAALALFFKKNLGIEATEEHIKESLGHFKEGAVQKGMDILKMTPLDEMWSRLSQDLGVRGTQLSQLREVPWKEFKAHHQNEKIEKSYFRTALEKVGLAKTELSDEELKGEIGTKIEENRLYAFIKKYEDEGKITIEEGENIDQILRKIDAVKQKEAKEKSEVKIIDSEAGFVENFKHTFEASKTVSTAKDMYEYAANLIVGAGEDGAGFIVNDAGTFIMKYGVMAPVTNLHILGETIVDVAQGVAGIETPQGVLANYLRNTGYYIGMGGLAGASYAAIKGQSTVLGGLKGMKWGLLLPARFYDLSIKTARAAGLAGERLDAYAKSMETWTSVLSKDPETILRAQRAQALHHAVSLKNLLEKEEALTKSTPRKWLEFLDPLPKVTRERIRFHLSAFLESREAYLKGVGLDTATPLRVTDFETNNLKTEEIERATHEFLEEHSKVDLPGFRFQSKNNPEELSGKIASLSEATPRLEKIAKLKESITAMEAHFTQELGENKTLRAQGVSEKELSAKMQKTLDLGALERPKIEAEITKLASEVGSMSAAEKEEFARLLSFTSKGRVVRSFLTQNALGRGKCAAVFGAARVIWGVGEWIAKDPEDRINEELLKLTHEVSVDILELTINICAPFGVTDWWTVCTGKSVFGNDVGIWGRALAGVSGVYSVATDTASTIAALGTAEFAGAGGAAVFAASNAVEAGLRAGSRSPEIIAAARKIVPRLQELAQSSGGWQKLMSMLKGEKLQKALAGAEKWSARGLGTAMAASAGMMVYEGWQIAYETDSAQTIEIPEEIASSIEVGEEEALGLAA